MSHPSGLEPRPLKRDGFQCGRRRARVEGKRLKELFNPKSLGSKQEQESAKSEADFLFKKPFFIGQLKHYGIKFPSNASLGRLRALLEDAVAQGKCDQVPEPLVSLEQSMRREYEQKWDEEFAKCTTPGQRALCNLDRFLEYYFLTDGLPDKTKTPEPLALHGFDDAWSMKRKTDSIPDLHSRIGGPLSKSLVCIGWDRDAVWALAKRLKEEAAKAQKKLDDARWEEKMEAHRQYLARSSRDGPSRSTRGRPTNETSPGSFTLERCLGSYLVQAEEVTDGWDDVRPGDLTLDICIGGNGVLYASYHFGIIEGTMLLSLSDEKLEAISPCQSETGSSEDSEPSSDEAGEADDAETDKGTKRMAPTTDTTNPKRRKVQPPRPRRVYYRMRGRETGEGEMFPGPGGPPRFPER
ncbi:hypothetical protein QQZ08_002716 [Neonectria magnoliae]|uniref:Uncharacterized protein n=1 Tax=Neonectria magnoliae TaxID=2732573 RepID=A0ABR1ICK8_9HYPO